MTSCCCQKTSWQMPEPQGLYPTHPPQEQQSPERRSTVSLGWPGSLRFSNGPLGGQRRQTFNAFRTNVTESPMAMSEWGGSDYYPDSSPEKSEYWDSPDSEGPPQCTLFVLWALIV